MAIPFEESAELPTMTSKPSAQWSHLRTQLLALLAGKDADASQLYGAAINAIERPLTRPSLMITSHCIRELVKVLPVILGYPHTERSDASRSARELHRKWTASGLSLTPEETNDAEAVSIPMGVFNAARDVAQAGSEGSKNSRELTALIVTGQTGESESASVRRVHKSIEMFRGLAHARDYTQPETPIPSFDHVMNELGIIEEALMNRLANMADRASMVRALLADANQKQDEGTKP